MEKGNRPIDRAARAERSPLVNRLGGFAVMAEGAAIEWMAFFSKDFAPQTSDKVKAGLIGIVGIGLGKLVLLRANFLERNRNTQQNPPQAA